jgi:hypothetical protein
LKGDIFKLKEDIGHPDTLGAILLAIITTQTVPDHPGSQGPFLKAELQTVHNLMGQEPQLLYGILIIDHYRAGVGAGHTVETGIEGTPLKRKEDLIPKSFPLVKKRNQGLGPVLIETGNMGLPGLDKQVGAAQMLKILPQTEPQFLGDNSNRAKLGASIAPGTNGSPFLEMSQVLRGCFFPLSHGPEGRQFFRRQYGRVGDEPINRPHGTMFTASSAMGAGIQFDSPDRGHIGRRGLGPVHDAVDQKDQRAGQDMKKFSEGQKGQA